MCRTSDTTVAEPPAKNEPQWSALRRFLLPKPDRRFFVRLTVTALSAWLFFGYVCIPCWIRGSSMEPNWRDGEFTFCCRLPYLLRGPRRGDVVALRLAGRRVMFLKRVVAFAGETVEFRDGVLFVNGRPLHESYVRLPCSWTIPPHKVRPGKIFVVGDNRSMPPEQHRFGEIDPARIVGTPLW